MRNANAQANAWETFYYPYFTLTTKLETKD